MLPQPKAGVRGEVSASVGETGSGKFLETEQDKVPKKIGPRTCYPTESKL